MIQEDRLKEERATRRPTAMRAAWCTILVFLVLSLGLVLAAYHGARVSMSEMVEAHVEVEAPPPVFEAPKGVVEDWARRAAEVATKAATTELRARLDVVFAPVHAAVPAYADFHYSVLGEYIELTEAALRSVSSSMEERLFEGFDPRLIAALDEVGKTYQAAFRSEIEQSAEAGRLALGEEAILGAATRLAIEDTVARAGVGVPAEIAAAGVGAIGAKAAAAALGKALVKGVAKIAAKSAVKPLGIGGAAAAGAAAGSPAGPPGAVIGGVVGAALGWFTMDYAIVKIDELISREAFEADLHALIDGEQELLALRIEDLLASRAGVGVTMNERRESTLNPGMMAAPAQE